ncbi:hypothetical protein [Emcibacter nanhaiensis]|uniref:Uncharacterized protein n=1 Tax=Emcibacter nanhaiensis TaxID=1505037 RepID=A0A501PHJ3_9PROT|nr:hypothetical protein [Emcibacter nanhaiensis]TPD59538.1 hypothetical protein FIV46_10655 [Emcibacter nanhaiensis]
MRQKEQLQKKAAPQQKAETEPRELRNPDRVGGAGRLLERAHLSRKDVLGGVAKSTALKGCYHSQGVFQIGNSSKASVSATMSRLLAAMIACESDVVTLPSNFSRTGGSSDTGIIAQSFYADWNPSGSGFWVTTSNYIKINTETFTLDSSGTGALRIDDLARVLVGAQTIKGISYYIAGESPLTCGCDKT